ncbi:hypothetical protein [Bradyrhizobium liaoningense]|uniref:hypothetical protein n=1 Tax=Bradyrhizobium liaoningense TaxID=43992 RepID=UPI001FCC24E4|nr:hypothetical protein [Bradyrhizobium liaoningense]GLR93512.1 hypothetical protein GCM10007858_11390 [Bradyrhizobium liaoningense]
MSDDGSNDSRAGAVEYSDAIPVLTTKVIDRDFSEVFGEEARANPFLAKCREIFRLERKVSLISCEHADGMRAEPADTIGRYDLPLTKATRFVDTGSDDGTTRKADNGIDGITEAICGLRGLRFRLRGDGCHHLLLEPV